MFLEHYGIECLIKLEVNRKGEVDFVAPLAVNNNPGQKLFSDG